MKEEYREMTTKSCVMILEFEKDYKGHNWDNRGKVNVNIILLYQY